MINIKGFDKARVLLALYNGSHVQGMGFIQARGALTLEECSDIIDKMIENQKDIDQRIGRSNLLGRHRELYFDYLFGRVIKCDIGGDELDSRLYDRDLGQGAAEMAILEEFTKPTPGGTQ